MPHPYDQVARYFPPNIFKMFSGAFAQDAERAY